MACILYLFNTQEEKKKTKTAIADLLRSINAFKFNDDHTISQL